MNTIQKQVKTFLVVHFICFQFYHQNIPPLKTPSNWAIFTTQLILRLNSSVMKRFVDDNLMITTWEE
jgi:hypothetical protein